MASLTPTDDDEIISIPGETRIAFASRWVEAVRTGRKDVAVRRVPDKLRIAHIDPSDKSFSPGTSGHVLYLSEKAAFGRKWRFCSEGPAVIASLRYLHRYASPNMQRE